MQNRVKCRVKNQKNGHEEIIVSLTLETFKENGMKRLGTQTSL